MPEQVEYDTDDYTFHDPRTILTLHDHDFNVIAYGVPDDEDEPEAMIKPVDWGPQDDAPLPQPPHTAITPTKTCLACEWANLKKKIADA